MKKNISTRSNIKRRRDHGFRSRTLTRSGRNTLRRRRRKGRWQLIPS